MISIIDYGMGNLRSVQKAFEKLGIAAEIVTRPDQVRAAKKLVLPGVGAFRDAMRELQKLELVEPLRQFIHTDRPFLGICLGLQLLFDVSYEDGEWPGLGVLPGDVIPRDNSIQATCTEYGPRFTSMVERGNLFATQFHPEKSQKVGLKMLSNFAAL